MAYEEQFLSSPLTGSATEGVSEDVLPLPQFRRVENFVYEKEGEMSLRRNLTLLTNFFEDNPIQLFTYKNQLLIIGEEEYTGTMKLNKNFLEFLKKKILK